MLVATGKEAGCELKQRFRDERLGNSTVQYLV